MIATPVSTGTALAPKRSANGCIPMSALCVRLLCIGTWMACPVSSFVHVTHHSLLVFRPLRGLVLARPDWVHAMLFCSSTREFSGYR